MAFPNSALRTLLMVCPLLESLGLVRCAEATEYTLLTSKLKSLVIDSCPDLMRVAVITKNLRRFKFVGAMVQFGFTDLSLLEEAEIDLRPSLYYDEEPGESLHDLLMNFYRARVLTVCCYTTQVIPTASKSYELAGSMGARQLTIRTAFDDNELCGIACLLNSCPLVEKLRFEIVPRELYEEEELMICDDEEVDPETFWEEGGAPRCIMYGVEEVEIEGFGRENEVRFLRFVLRSGRVLKNIKLRLARDEEDEWVQLYKDLPTIIRRWKCITPYQLHVFIH